MFMYTGTKQIGLRIATVADKNNLPEYYHGIVKISESGSMYGASLFIGQ